ncbi:TetR family transcriptional regulator [Pseudoclavibacter endophyticus]|uniref:TetR/AcrR family transcriptional regulator n=1 Tax=Pseudoclavibacter endophyticus TaxID=1778590 RepID=A0A6H9WKX6_9MICO|nr:TetR-like C-terminal domain-containing protein [Pseudoclavibacter endophyticus]KAB1649466.1 TetR/AcrR family transcriptional regulator [Pseudoclavibacter endophyticus]GGA62420.1 TetR family transcriptional regulator [Pseudoclavibacter endophyticus]
MTDSTARRRRSEARRARILAAARARADADGWVAVTTRHLADAIGYTQPVLYTHFPAGKSEIMLAVALEGYDDLTRRCRDAVAGNRGRPAIEAVATAYLDFGQAHPAVYEAMFQQAIDARFASGDTPPALRTAFETLAAAIGDQGDGTITEVFWAALHGIHLLERAGRLRPEHRADRVTELSARFAP